MRCARHTRNLLLFLSLNPISLCGCHEREALFEPSDEALRLLAIIEGTGATADFGYDKVLHADICTVVIDARVEDVPISTIAELPVSVSVFLKDRCVGGEEICELANASNIISLQMSKSRISQDAIGNVESLENLESFTLEACTIDLDDKTTLRLPPTLRQLELRDIESVETLLDAWTPRSLSQLKSLDLSGSPIAPSNSAFQKAVNLHELFLASTPANDETMKCVSPMVNLRKLDLSQTEITDIGLSMVAKLRALEFLFVSGTEVTTTGLLNLVPALPKLYLLDTTNTTVDSERVQALRPTTMNVIPWTGGRERP